MSEDVNPTPTPEVAPTPEQAANPAPAAVTPAPEPALSQEPVKPIAAGGVQPNEPEQKSYWPDDWRQKQADYLAGGDEKLKAKRLKQLERYVDPNAITAKAFELESKFSEGGLIKIPGKDASEEDIKAFNKALGVPEDPKEYVEKLELPNGITLGERDKTLFTDFASKMHKVGFTQPQMNMVAAWKLETEEAIAADLDKQDDTNKTQSLQALKEEWGPAFKRNTNAISSLFAYAPGGADMQNDGALFNRLLGGRMADGRIIGDDPDMVKFLVAIAKEVNPVATVVESADGSGKGIDDEIADIEKLMRTDRPAYNKDTNKQARYLELLGARDKHRARSA